MRLAEPPHRIADEYDVVVVGSGYGGGVAASRLARAGRSVLVLERGLERGRGEFPGSAAAALREVQIDSPDGRSGDPRDLYDVRRNDDMTVLVASGLGGGSLINAGVALEADARVFEDPRWPAELREPGVLDEGYAQARRMLAPTPYPNDAPPKLRALRTGAAAIGARFETPPLTITFAEGPNHVGVRQNACRECGDCVAGCNFRAKNSVDVTYLADARRHGAQIATEVAVRRVSRAADGRWLVHYRAVRRGFGGFRAPDLFVRAADVVLAAGTLGSTEILLRSRSADLEFSPRLGHGFTANGDVLAFAYNCDDEVRGAGFGDAEDRLPVGPCITGLADLRRPEDELERGIVVQEGAMPSTLGPILASGLLAARVLDGRESDDDGFADVAQVLTSLATGGGAVDHTLTYLVMAHDGGGGELRLVDDRLRLAWPTTWEESPRFAEVHDRLYAATAALGGTYVKNPTASPALGQDGVTVHPMGGACMGPDAAHGVVDHVGRVYAGATGTAVHEGLHVWDGAVVPRSLGVNPLLTITALAERCATELAARRGWSLDRTLARHPAPLPDGRATSGVRFTERMAGGFVRTPDGRESPFSFTVAVTIEDLDGFRADERRTARLFGVVQAEELHPEPLMAARGTVELLVADVVRPGDPARPQPGTRRMTYRMPLTATDGTRYHLEGEKLVADDPGFDLWHDTTNLTITVRSGGPDGPVVGHGVLRIAWRDLLRQAATIGGTAPTLRGRVAAQLGFARFFTRSLADTYTRPEPVRPSRIRPYTLDGVPDAQITMHDITAGDGLPLCMVRFHRGGGSAVLVTHGLTTSTDMFVMPEHRNLVTHLLDEGFDVWCLDTRLSNRYEYSTTRQDVLDDCALFDFPPALAEIRHHTAAPVHVVAHCLGSTAFTMSLFGGFVDGISSVVANSVALTPRVPGWSRLKLGVTPELLGALGIATLNPRWDEGSWLGLPRLIGRGVSLVHRECDEPACHMLSLMWGTGMPALFRHENMHPDTHHRLRDLFGPVGMSHYRHVRAMVAAGRAVRFRPPEGPYAAVPADYLSRAGRITTPVLFSTGADNKVFADSNLHCHRELAQRGATWHEHVSFTGYGHQDVFMGRDSARDVFPWMVEFLRRHDPVA